MEANPCGFFFNSVLLLKIHYQEREGWDTFNQFNSATFVCLSQARTWNSICLCSGLFVSNYLRRELEVVVHFVNIAGIVDHHC